MDAVCQFLSLPAALLSKIPGIGPVVKAASTSVGQKILMAITGLLLCGFLVAHLGGNLLFLGGEGPFNDYAHKLHSWGPLLAAAEVGLFGLFVAHIGLAISTAAMNRQARRKRYAVKESKMPPAALPNGGASGWMMVTGGLILFFLVVHIMDMKMKNNPFVDYEPAKIQIDEERFEYNPYHVVKAALTQPMSAWAYVVGLVALGIHLSHGVRSALQTLGVSHPRWNRLLEILSQLFAIVIAGGFMFLLIWAALKSGI